MPFKKGQGGRPKGLPNKRNRTIEEIVERLDVDPFEVLCMFAKGDWKGLGYDKEFRVSFTSAGIEFEEPIIKPEHRLTAAKECVKYLYAQKKALEVSASPEQAGFKIVVEDYT